MNKFALAYNKSIVEAFDLINQEYDTTISQAAELMVASIERDELIHVFGTGGHSTMGAMEIFWRAGSLAPVNPLLDASLLPSNGAVHSNWMERTEGLAANIMHSYGVKKGETLIIVNAYGINPVTIDAALTAQAMGVKTIGVTSTGFANSVPRDARMRHSTGKNLHELVDVFVDCHLPLGDATVAFEGLNQKVGPTSTILNSYCLNLLIVATVEKLLAKNIEPPVWMSANLPEGDAANKKWHKKYNERVKHLR
ncbi:MAG: SIS domain-containing protein [Sphaerochaeta sp.]|nr:SIS domain-containing protein [Sphaerochaeta sp.]